MGGATHRAPLDAVPTAQLHDAPGAPLAESMWVEPWPDATLVVEDGLASPEASALQRARRTDDERLPERSQQETLRDLGDERLRAIVGAYSDALERGDVDAVVALLTEDATWSMPPVPTWYRGREVVAAFLAEYPLRERWRHVPTRANGQLAVGCYMWDSARGTHVAAVLDVLTLRGDWVADVVGFLAPWVFRRFGDGNGVMVAEAFARFGLPDAVPA